MMEQDNHIQIAFLPWAPLAEEIKIEPAFFKQGLYRTVSDFYEYDREKRNAGASYFPTARMAVRSIRG
jgi:hypothetical protein